MKTSPVELMLQDVVRELIDKALSAKADAAKTAADFDKGRQFALYDALSLLVQQADAFGIDRKDIGLAGVDPERDILMS